MSEEELVTDGAQGPADCQQVLQQSNQAGCQLNLLEPFGLPHAWRDVGVTKSKQVRACFSCDGSKLKLEHMCTVAGSSLM